MEVLLKENLCDMAYVFMKAFKRRQVFSVLSDDACRRLAEYLLDHIVAPQTTGAMPTGRVVSATVFEGEATVEESGVFLMSKCVEAGLAMLYKAMKRCLASQDALAWTAG
jgi:hypothetical protein